MSFFNFNDAAPQNDTDLIPKGTQAKVCMVIRHGKDGIVTTFSSGWECLQAEMTILSAPMARRKIFQNIGIGGPTEGHQKSAEISRSLLRAILESAQGIDPKDESDRAKTARQIQGWDALQEIEFAIEIGIDKAKEEKYQDRNKIQKVLTPDHKNYARVMAGETIMPASPAGSAPSFQGAPPVHAAPSAGANPNPVPTWAN